MLRIATLITVMLVTGMPTDSFAKSRRTSSETAGPGSNDNAACASSARRFCKAEGADQMAVLACLQRNRSKISASCRKVLEGHGV